MKIYLFIGVITLLNIGSATAKSLPVLPPTAEVPLNDNVVRALKEALSIGVDSAVSRVSSLDGFLRDEVIKILLPPEASQIVTRLNQSNAGRKVYRTTLQPIVNDLITSMNRAAEDASKQAGPIFLEAIKTISIPEALNILAGTDTAATAYLRSRTFDPLTEVFKPSIQTSLDKKLLGNQSTNELWGKFVNTYNDIRRTPIRALMNLDAPAEPDLATYVTQRALNGVFIKVGEEEQKIRKNPVHQVTDLLKDVFGGLGKKN